MYPEKTTDHPHLLVGAIVVIKGLAVGPAIKRNRIVNQLEASGNKN